MGYSHRRTYVTIALVAALMLLAALAAACSAQADQGLAGSAAPSATVKGGDTDWTRILKALGYMKSTRPTKPVVILLGGSAARESTISDQSWRDQIVDKGGPATLAWNMGSRNRTMARNVAIVKNLPADAHAVVFIGINLGAFTSTKTTASITLPSPLPTESPDLQQPHQYGTTKTGILSTSKKRALVKGWLADRYPVYKRNFATSARVLETLIKVCRARGYKPVLFELPRDTAVIGSSLSVPTAKYRARCKVLSTKYDIPWVSLVNQARVPNRSFYDLWHLVEPGRNTWQRLLSVKTAALLKTYKYDGGGS